VLLALIEAIGAVVGAYLLVTSGQSQQNLQNVKPKA